MRKTSEGAIRIDVMSVIEPFRIRSRLATRYDWSASAGWSSPARGESEDDSDAAN